MLFFFLFPTPALPLQAQGKEDGSIVDGAKSLFDRFRKKTAPEDSDDENEKGGGLLGGIKKALGNDRGKSLVDGVGGVWESSNDSSQKSLGFCRLQTLQLAPDCQQFSKSESAAARS